VLSRDDCEGGCVYADNAPAFYNVIPNLPSAVLGGMVFTLVCHNYCSWWLCGDGFVPYTLDLKRQTETIGSGMIIN